mmetsp:Transcript_24886/g.52746  ORF Transcript_24886/g.52746 Transcript_24886/m.52746 type:complete len:240 (-) Transcript_24886:1065-1784(-)
MSSLPNRRSCCPPFLNTCFSSTGSNDGSSTSSTFSKRMGPPSRMPFSSVRRKFGVDSLMTPRPKSFFMLLIQRFPCPCGSIISGQRRPRVTRMPFSMERSSEGKDLMFHSRVSDGSIRTSTHFHCGSAAKFTSLAFPSQALMRSLRKSAVNGPAYAMKPAAKVILPTTNERFFSKTLLAASQRTASLPNPARSFSARPSFTFVCSESSSSFSALLFAFMSCNCRAATLSWTTFNSDFFP